MRKPVLILQSARRHIAVPLAAGVLHLGKLKDHPAYRAWLAGLEREWLEYRRDFGSSPDSA